jgi:hypothetical protein
VVHATANEARRTADLGAPGGRPVTLTHNSANERAVRLASMADV